MSGWVASEGASFPLGATWIEDQRAYNFALYSQHAESVTLLLYKEDDTVSPVFIYPFDVLNNKSGRFWHCRIPRGPTVYLTYHSHSLAFYLNGIAEEDEDLYVIINAYWEPLYFAIHVESAMQWTRVIDMSLDRLEDLCESEAEVRLPVQTYPLQPLPVVVLVR